MYKTVTTMLNAFTKGIERYSRRERVDERGWYYGCSCIAFKSDGTVALSDGGQRSTTIKIRLNALLQHYKAGFKIIRLGRRWYLLWDNGVINPWVGRYRFAIRPKAPVGRLV